MIVDMKKITLLCVESAKDETLEALRDLGVLHLTAVTPPGGEDLDAAQAYYTHVQRALEVLPRGTKGKPSGRSAEEIVEDIWSLIHRRKDFEQRHDELNHEIRRMEPYGSFDPSAIARLREEGITVKLYHSARGEQIDLPEHATRVDLCEDKNGSCFAVVKKGEINLPVEEVRLPEKSLNDLKAELKKVDQELSAIEKGFEAHAGDYAEVARVVQNAEDQVRYLEAREGMGVSAAVAYLRGYCPTEKVAAVEKASAIRGWGLIVEEPAPEDKAPTLIRMPKWVKPIKTIFDLIGIEPGYHEVDISPVFLIFLSIFFAMLVGDAGYGAIFFALTWVARRKFKTAPAQPFAFMYIMSVSTILWGVITGNYFGYFDATHPLPSALGRLVIPWLTDPQYSDKHLMMLCFLIGAIHLTVAHFWNAVRFAPSLQSLAQVGWICSTWTMYFAARTMVLGDPFPRVMFFVLAVGITLIVIFMTPVKKLKEEWFNHAILPLNIISNFTDVVSYVRLFAVGSASFAVANAFNEMLLAGGFDNIFAGLVKALLLFAGHALNVGLCGLGILVHGVRLNTLEFSSHIGMQWSGFPYKPFARKKQTEPGAAVE